MWKAREPYHRHFAIRSSAHASGPEPEPSLVRASACPRPPTERPCCKRREAATAASRAITSRALPYLAVARKISARPPSAKRPTPAVYLIPSCSNVRSSCPRRFGRRWRVMLSASDDLLDLALGENASAGATCAVGR